MSKRKRSSTRSKGAAVSASQLSFDAVKPPAASEPDTVARQLADLLAEPAESELSAIECLVLSKLFASEKTADKIRAQVGPTNGPVPVDFVAHVKGMVSVAPDGTAAPTARFLTKHFFALLIHRLGAVNPSTLDLIVECALATIREADKDAAYKKLVKACPEIARVELKIDEAVAKLPQIERKGVVTSLVTATKLLTKTEELPASTRAALEA
jgi:hypothetical protein